MTTTASLLSAGEILKQDSLGRVRTPLTKKQEVLAAFDGSGMSAARFAAMAGINYSTFSSWVKERNQRGQELIIDILALELRTKSHIDKNGIRRRSAVS